MSTPQKQLFSLIDPAYKAFHQKLMPTVNPDTVLGIRTPVLRKFAKDFYHSPAFRQFLQELPHTYYEENNLHAFLIEQIPDFDTALAETELFLPYIDNWATCDSFLPKVFKKQPDALYPTILRWLKSREVYTVRYGIGLLLKLFLDDLFCPEHLNLVAEAAADAYYINMMIAWYFATALAKQQAATLPWLTEKRLPVWIHNKTIQKAVESYRITPDIKAMLKVLRIR